FSHVKNCHNSGMLETPDRLGFANEAFAELFFLFRFLVEEGNRLQSDQPIDLRVTSLVYDAHGAAPQFRNNLISAEYSALSIFHGQRARKRPPPGSLGPQDGLLAWYPVSSDLARLSYA